MPVTLDQARLAAPDALTATVINEFLTSPIFELMPFDEIGSPIGGGGFTASYLRVEARRKAGFRAINSEYPAEQSTVTKHSVDLKVLGGRFEIDRKLMGIGALDQADFQLQELMDATKAKFSDAVINGDSTVDEDGFEGLSKSLAGTSTEVTDTFDFSGAIDTDKSFEIMEVLDDLQQRVQGESNALIANRRTLAKIRSALRRSSAYTRTPGPRGTYGEYYGSLRLIDAGQADGSDNRDIIPVRAGGLTDLYVVRIAVDSFCGLTTQGGELLTVVKPTVQGASNVKSGAVDFGPVGVALKKTKGAAVARNVKL